MDNLRRKINGSNMEAGMISFDPHSEIGLYGAELLKLEPGQPGVRVICTTGTLWLTQPGDPEDHLLQAGQSFPLNQPGTVLVQGLPSGTALLREMDER